MRTSHLLTSACFLFLVAAIVTRANMTGIFPISPDTNLPPTANNDTFIRHGGGAIGPLLQNDSDPEGDPMSVEIETFPTQGHLLGLDGNSFTYAFNIQSFTGTDSFTYRACDWNNACSGIATVTINVVNQAPTATGDSYPVHGGTTIGPMMVNDFDPDSDPIIWDIVTFPSHGTLFGLADPAPDLKSFAPFHGYTGPDSFTYHVCDQFGLCSAPATVTLSINNNPPVPGPDFYVVRGGTIIGPLLANDSDPEGDDFAFLGASLTVAASHGQVFGLTNDLHQYVPNSGFAGIDTFQYEITDYLGASGSTTVTLFVFDGDDAENAGACSPCAGGGGLAGGNAVDHTNFDRKKAMDMAHATFDALRAFGKRNGCDCNGEPDWKAVQDFIDVGYSSGDPRDFSWHVSDAQLRRKIQILGVPWRSPNGR